MSNDTMLYKTQGPLFIHGGNFDYIIVDQDNHEAFEAALASGWFKTTDEAKAGFVIEQTKETGPTVIVKPKKIEKAW